RGQKLTSASLAKRLNIAPQAVTLLTRLLTILCEDGVLVAARAGWQVASLPEAQDVQKVSKALSEKYPAYEDTLALLERNASRIPGLLRGESATPPEVATEESTDEAKRLDESPYNAVYRLLIAEAVRSIAGFLPANRTIRVLEIGAGIGGLTIHTLPTLPAGRTEYVFSDVSNALFQVARPRLGD